MRDPKGWSRRRLLELVGGGGLSGIAGCGQQNAQTEDDMSTTTATETSSTSTKTIVFTGTSTPTTTSTEGRTVVFGGGDGKSFADALGEASVNPGVTLEIEEGTYELGPDYDTKHPEMQHFLAEGLQDVTIEGNGSTIVFDDPTRGGLNFVGGEDVAIRNLTVDFDPVPFTQGEIVGLSDDKRTMTVELDEGFASLDHRMFDSAANVWASVHTQDGEFVRGIRQSGDPDKHFSSMEDVGDRRFSLTLTRYSNSLGLETGRKLVIVARDNHSVLRFYKVDKPTIQNVTIHSSNGGGMSFGVCGKPTVQGCEIRPPQNSGRLISTDADGVRFVNCLSEPTIENSRLEYLEDDGIVVQHTLSQVKEFVDNRTIVTGNIHPFVVDVGDVLAGLSVSGVRRGRLPPVSDIEVKQRTGGHDSRPKPSAITFEEPVDDVLEVGDFVGNIATACRNFTVRNNVVRNHRVNLVRIAASQGRVEGNVLEGSHRNAIELECDTSTRVFAPKGWSSNIVVRGNRIARPGLNYFASEGAAGIRVHHESPRDVRTEGRPNRDIVIAENEVSNGAYMGLLVKDAKGVQMDGNELSSLNKLYYEGFGDVGLKLGNVADASVVGNSVTGSEESLDHLGVHRRSENVHSSNNELVIGGESVGAELIPLVPIRFMFDRAVQRGWRFLAFMCRELELVDDSGGIVRSIDVGSGAEGVDYGMGVYSREESDSGDWRWFGGPTSETFLYFSEDDLSVASELRLRGNPYQAGISAAVYVDGKETDEVSFGTKTVQTYFVSLS